MSPKFVTTAGRWFLRGVLVGILISASLIALSFFFRSERGGNLLGTSPDRYEALGFPRTLWETGNTYGGLFIDLPALLTNALELQESVRAVLNGTRMVLAGESGMI